MPFAVFRICSPEKCPASNPSGNGSLKEAINDRQNERNHYRRDGDACWTRREAHLMRASAIRFGLVFGFISLAHYMHGS